MNCLVNCSYNNGMEIGKVKCRLCHKKFHMEGSCCLDLCGDHSRCRGCKNGMYSEEYKEWRNRYVKQTKHLCNKTIDRASKF